MNVNGTGYLYFTYPYSYGDLTMIKDPNGFIIHDVTNPTASLYTNFTYSVSPILTNLITGATYGTYKMYRTLITCSYTGDGEFEFIF